MLDELHSIPIRITVLKAKLAARKGRAEFKQNCVEIRAEIERLEAATIRANAVLASQDKSGDSDEPQDVT